MAQKIYDTCENCGGTGVCRPCGGTGRSGFFLTLTPDLETCRWCKGSAICRRCEGTGKMVVFEPYVYVKGSLTTPVSITSAAFSGIPWRYIGIPDDVLALGEGEQLAWVSARVRQHYTEAKGECLLFGKIVGYQFVMAPKVRVHFDTEGRRVEPEREEPGPGTLSLGIGNKTVEVRRDGTLKIDANGKETK